jgi:hypothetical protein
VQREEEEKTRELVKRMTQQQLEKASNTLSMSELIKESTITISEYPRLILQARYFSTIRHTFFFACVEIFLYFYIYFHETSIPVLHDFRTAVSVSHSLLYPNATTDAVTLFLCLLLFFLFLQLFCSFSLYLQ